jgi:hypothetical protein
MTWVWWYLGVGLSLGLLRGILHRSFWAVPLVMVFWLPFVLAVMGLALLFLLADSFQAEETYKDIEEGDYDGRDQ